MVEITYQMVLSTLQTVGILVGIIYYITIMRNQYKTREAQFLLQLNQVFQDKEAIKDWYDVFTMEFQDYQEFLEKYDSTVNLENYLQRSRIYRMLNTFGQLLKKGLVSPETVYDGIQGGFIEGMWNKQSLHIRKIREQFNTPRYLDGFEYLAEAMKKVDEEKQQLIT
jgi:hypothetical protein